MANLFPPPKMQFLDINGEPLVGGKLYTYATGTTTPLATYTNSGGGTPNTNPIIIDSRGEASIWLGNVSYSIVLKNSADVQIWAVDNINYSMTHIKPDINERIPKTTIFKIIKSIMSIGDL